MSKTAEIIGVGTELLLGNVVNSDAQYVSQELSALGINVYYHTVVGDNPERLKSAVEIAKGRADIIITTGGLGPTYDDLTKQVLAESFGKPLVFIEEEAERVRSFFKGIRSAQMTENNLSQAWFPEGCEILANTKGTAPGCAFESDGIHVLMLPGPPNELRAMLTSGVIPYLSRLSEAEIVSHNICIFGMGESAVEDKLHDLMTRLQNPTLAPYAKMGEVTLRVTAKAATKEQAEEMMRPVISEVCEVLGDIVYGIDAGSLEETVLKRLIEKKLTLSVAESCTGGLLAKRLTDIPGASAVFTGGVVAYSNSMKTQVLGVNSETLSNYGAVSTETAEEMAQGIQELLHTDLAVAITGIAGPAAEQTDKKVGTVYIALTDGNTTQVRELKLGFERDRVRVFAVHNALDMIRRHISTL